MKIILIGNYKKDDQKSMDRFANALHDGYSKSGIVSEIWTPNVWLAKKSKSAFSGLGKWLGYIDKFIIFSIKLKFATLKKENRSPDVRFHICDHSNSFYIHFLPKNRTLITCHDVLAIRGAFGYKDAYCPASKTGVLLQKWILGNIAKFRNLIAVSHFTLNQLNSLLQEKVKTEHQWSVIHNGFNENFYKMDLDQVKPLLKKVNISSGETYILHVGSDLIRKNRKMLIDMVYHLSDQYLGKICFAGQAIDSDLLSHAVSMGLEHRLISVVNPDHETLVALYNGCYSFIFPSFSEGFGWPLIEAQACGAPVITSLLQPFLEVAGQGALYADPHSAEGFAQAFLELSDHEKKLNLVENGLKNCLRFDCEKMVNSYLKIHFS